MASYTIEIKKVRSELIEYGNQGVGVLLSEMVSNPSPRRKSDIILFFDQANLVNEEILSAVKKMAISQDLDNLNPSVLVRSIDYLGNHGSQADIALLESFNAHNSQGIPKLVKLATQKIEKPKRGEKPDKPSGPPPEAMSKPVQPTPEPTFAKKPLTPAKEPAEPEAGEAEADSNPFPYWIFIIGGVVLGRLVVLLRRK